MRTSELLFQKTLLLVCPNIREGDLTPGRHLLWSLYRTNRFHHLAYHMLDCCTLQK